MTCQIADLLSGTIAVGNVERDAHVRWPPLVLERAGFDHDLDDIPAMNRRP
jgi:hypothetical protein